MTDVASDVSATDTAEPATTPTPAGKGLPTPAANSAMDTGSLELIPGGFTYRDGIYDLTGRPRAMLRALLESRYRRLSADYLATAMEVDAMGVEDPRRVVIDAAKKLRATLKVAAKAAGVARDNPLISRGKGRDLTYELKMS